MSVGLFAGYYPSMSMKRSPKDLWRQAKQTVDDERLREKPARDVWEQEAVFHIALFNHRLTTDYPVTSWPTMRAALMTGYTLMGVLCPGCRQRGSIDLRTISCHPDTSINALIPYLKCGRCQPNPPLAKIVALRLGAP